MGPLQPRAIRHQVQFAALSDFVVESAYGVPPPPSLRGSPPHPSLQRHPMTLLAPVVDVLKLELRVEDDIVILQLPADQSFESLRDLLKARLPAHPEVGGAMCRLDIGERAIALFDLRRLVSLLRDEFDLNVTGLYARTEQMRVFTQSQLKLRVFCNDPEPEDPGTEEEEQEEEIDLEELFEAPPPPNIPPRDHTDPRPAPDHHRTLHLQKTLRSGHACRFDGDVVVYGDVNPGAQIVADGNIVVLGTLKGMAHAGAGGEAGRFVIALNFAPHQVRIGEHILPDPDGAPGPRIAQVVEGQIAVDNYQGKAFR
jgi:septum site-determining protein MinC